METDCIGSLLNDVSVPRTTLLLCGKELIVCKTRLRSLIAERFSEQLEWVLIRLNRLGIPKAV
jgi:hypothetical protein